MWDKENTQRAIHSGKIYKDIQELKTCADMKTCLNVQMLWYTIVCVNNTKVLIHIT